MRKSLNIGLALVCAITGFLFFACSASVSDTELLSVVAISRHGIRSQTQPLSKMNLYTQRPEGFPLWPAPADNPGYLSTVGKQNVTLLGSWYRDFYMSHGLLPRIGICPDAGTVFVYADIDERTLETAQGYLDGMFSTESTPDCGFQVNHTTELVDPYFDTLGTGICKVDTAVDQAAFNAKTGSNPDSLKTIYATQLQDLQTVTQCCQPSACATPTNPTPSSCSILELPSEVSVRPTTGALSFGPLFNVASAITEMFQLEYAQGMPETGCETTQGAQCVGWGAIPAGGLNDMMQLHVMYFDLTFGLPSMAQTTSSNLMSQVIGTMDQALTGVKSPNILAPVGSKFTMFVGHDGNITSIAQFMGGVNWQAEGFQQDDPGPAGAFVFELHKVKAGGQYIVRLYYVIATLAQMRNTMVLSLQTPPQRVLLTIPACGNTDCPYDQFKTLITSNIRQDCLVTSSATP